MSHSQSFASASSSSIIWIPFFSCAAIARTPKFCRWILNQLIAVDNHTQFEVATVKISFVWLVRIQTINLQNWNVHEPRVGFFRLFLIKSHCMDLRQTITRAMPIKTHHFCFSRYFVQTTMPSREFKKKVTTKFCAMTTVHSK